MLRLFPYARWLGVSAGFLLLILVHASLLAQSSTGRYYYYQGTRIPLNVNPRLIAVRFDANTTRDAKRNLVNRLGDVENFDSGVVSPVGDLVFLPLRVGRDALAAEARLKANAGVQFASAVYDFGSAQLAETDEFLVRFKANLLDAQIAALNQAHNVSVVREQPFSDRVLVLKPNGGNPRSARELANAYVEEGIVDFAEPNFVIRVAEPPVSAIQPQLAIETTPNDVDFAKQWGLQNTRQFQGAQLGADIKAADAWNVTQGATAIKIAVIDEGVTASHTEFAGKVLTGYNALNGSSNTAPKANDYHGTAVAGVAAANSNNSSGIAGVCWFCQILPVKVAERDSQGNWTATSASLSSGIDWSWQHGADVLNNSWTMTAFSDSVLTAIVNARTVGRNNKGSTIIFATGNENKNVVPFPASLNSYVVAVGASNWCDARKTPSNDLCNNRETTWGSNYGSALDLVAPGLAIFTTCNGNACTNGTYGYLSGTSLAAPFVSGTVGLLYSLNPNLTPNQVQQALQTGAKDIGVAGKDTETGYGRLDAFRAIAALYNLKISVTDNRTLVRPGETLSYTISYANNGMTAVGTTKINVTVPANTTYVSSTPSFASLGGGKYQLNLGTLSSNATGAATFRIKVQPSAAGQAILFNASISGAFPELNSSDNSATDKSVGAVSQFYLPLIERDLTP